MNVVLAAAVAVVSALLIERLGIPDRVGDVVARARRCRGVLTDASLDDLEKERVLREESIRLFALFGLVAGGSVVAIGVPLAAVLGLEAAGVSSADAVVSTMVSPAFLAAAFGVGGLVWAWRRRDRR